MNVVTVVGARPQFIKAAVVSPALVRAGIHESVLDTGQHYDANMSAVFFEELSIPEPTWSLGIGSGPHGQQTGAMLAGIEAVLLDRRPDLVLVYGDTNSTVAGALAAAKLHVPLAHVEAGLRSFNRRMPEEVNRVVTDHLSDLLFAPTSTAVANLEREGIVGEAVVETGDVMFDLAVLSVPLAERSRFARAGDSPFVLVTVHRAENTDDHVRFEVILDALRRIAAEHRVIWPVHPRTAGLLDGVVLPDSVELIEPVGYVDMVALERAASVVVTDSGGVQKEAFFHGRPCVVLRDETEWVELVELGWVHLAPPTSAGRIVDAVAIALTSTGTPASPYGDGRAAERIAAALVG